MRYRQKDRAEAALYVSGQLGSSSHGQIGGTLGLGLSVGVVEGVDVEGHDHLAVADGNRATPGTVHVRVLPPIQTADMSRAEQKQLPDAVRQTILAEL